MKKIEAVIRPEKLEDIKEALEAFNIRGLMISQIMGCGRQKGRKEFYRGTQVNINLLPKIKIETVIRDEDLESVLDIICNTAKTGEVGDGKIFIYNVEDVIRIRTGERRENAL
ncbi:MAG: P-II family nitrogen regulator [Clostridiales bacterium]|nr:P-II family nitrogen regulator [Clostridiales bacterium]